jgi:hypothetical protein
MTPIERSTKWRKDNFNLHRLYNILSGCKKRAKEKGLPYDLTSAWFKTKAIDVGKCEDTGIVFNHEPAIKINNPHPFAPSICRKDTNKGYTQDNCKVVVWIHSEAKRYGDVGLLYHYCKEFIRTIEG